MRGLFALTDDDLFIRMQFIADAQLPFRTVLNM